MSIIAPPVSLRDNVEPIAIGAHVLMAGFVNSEPAFVTTEGDCLLGKRRSRVSDGVILIAQLGKDRIVTGDDAGRVQAIDSAGQTTVIADEKGRWIDAIALGPEGAVAWSCGKIVKARDGKGVVKELATDSTSRGLSFRPKGYQLAISQNGGALIWMPNVVSKPEKLEWKGSHLDVIWSPDARFVITSMQENALHGWRLPEKQHMRMTGYPGKTRSFAWSHDGHWLATSGADACIVWPFASKEGPMGKAPRECGVRPAKVSAVACHPSALVIAMGYEDGCILLCRLTDASEILVRPPERAGSRDAVTTIGWDDKGQRLVFGTAEGHAGLLVLP